MKDCLGTDVGKNLTQKQYELIVEFMAKQNDFD